MLQVGAIEEEEEEEEEEEITYELTNIFRQAYISYLVWHTMTNYNTFIFPSAR
jgi:hypothetical protein